MNWPGAAGSRAGTIRAVELLLITIGAGINACLPFVLHFLLLLYTVWEGFWVFLGFGFLFDDDWEV